MLSENNNFAVYNLFFDRYLKPVLRKNLYLFLLGLSFSVGDFKLILATTTFMVAMMVSYQVKTNSFDYYLRYLKKISISNQKPLFSSATIAGIASVFIYFSSIVYSQLDYHWLAFFVIMQTVFGGLGITFLTKQLFFSSSSSQTESSLPLSFDQLIQQLSDDSPMRRLWVINQVMNLWQDNQLNPQQVNELEEYLRLMKNLEFEPVILAKIDLSLEKLSLTNSQPLNIPRKKISNSNSENPLLVMQTVKSIQGN